MNSRIERIDNVMPAKAGIRQAIETTQGKNLGSRFRGSEGVALMVRPQRKLLLATGNAVMLCNEMQHLCCA